MSCSRRFARFPSAAGEISPGPDRLALIVVRYIMIEYMGAMAMTKIVVIKGLKDCNAF